MQANKQTTKKRRPRAALLSSDVPPEISVVLPIYNEQDVLPELYRRLSKTLKAMGKSYELIFVDDGSQDETFPRLNELHKSDPKVRALKFSRNFGHHLAITAGLSESRGDYVVLMDSDLQDRPEDIPRLYEKAAEGHACVYGVRSHRKDSLFKRFSSWAFLSFVNTVIRLDIPINTCVFRIMDRNFVDQFNALPERHRFVTGLMSWLGYSQVGIPVTHDKRFAGTTKYPLFKMILLAMHSITSFTIKPLQVASMVGVLTTSFSFLGILVLCYRKLVLGYGVLGWTSVMVTILFLGGVQLIALGLLGEYVGRSYDEQKQRPLYIVENRLCTTH